MAAVDWWLPARRRMWCVPVRTRALPWRGYLHVEMLLQSREQRLASCVLRKDRPCRAVAEYVLSTTPVASAYQITQVGALLYQKSTFSPKNMGVLPFCFDFLIANNAFHVIQSKFQAAFEGRHMGGSGGGIRHARRLWKERTSPEGAGPCP